MQSGNNSNNSISMSSKIVKKPMKMQGKSMISKSLSASTKKKENKNHIPNQKNAPRGAFLL